MVKKNKAAATLGRKGGKKGGLAKVPKGLALLPKEKQQEIRKKSAKARKRTVSDMV